MNPGHAHDHVARDHGAHDHPHASHDHHSHEHRGGVVGWFGRAFGAHSHDHGELAGDNAFATNELGIRTVRIALAVLGVTSILQVIIVLASGSVSLLADTAHNIGDAANSIPLLIAFSIARRAANRRFTYGYGRAEDVAGVLIVVSILVSAGIVFWESGRRLVDPQPLENLGWVVVAAIVGFVGNEVVATMQIGVGRRIGSEALISDGLHARTDGLTSLAVLIAAAGSWLDRPIVDPIIGLLIGTVILFISWDATKRIWGRLMDSVDPALTQRVEKVVCSRPDIDQVEQLRLRFVGHKLHGDMRLRLAPETTALLVDDLRHQLAHEVPELTDVVIETVETSLSG